MVFVFISWNERQRAHLCNILVAEWGSHTPPEDRRARSSGVGRGYPRASEPPSSPLIYAVGAFCFLHGIKMGFERREQNNLNSCFVNGDRRILQSTTLDPIRAALQNSRTFVTLNGVSNNPFHFCTSFLVTHKIPQKMAKVQRRPEELSIK